MPRCEALIRRLRQHEIITSFSRQTAQGCSSTAAVALLARRHGLSDRRIWQILKKSVAAPPQARAVALLRQPANSVRTGGNHGTQSAVPPPDTSPPMP